MSSVSVKPSFWRREHHLDRMNLKQLVVAYFQYPAIIAYLVSAAVCIGLYIWRPTSLVETLASILIAVLLYPLAWYCLHRWVLHSKWMWKSKLLASTWKRIHYDHHQDPNHLEVLFGALHTTLPTIAIFTAPLGNLYPHSLSYFSLITKMRSSSSTTNTHTPTVRVAYAGK